MDTPHKGDPASQGQGDPASQGQGDATSQARAAFEHGVVRDQSSHARIVIRGAERVEFVNRMCTNDARKVAGGFGLGAVLITAKGRIVDLVRLFARQRDGREGEDELVLLGSEGHGASLKEWLEKYVVMEELTIEDVGARESTLLAFGPRAKDAVAAVLKVELPAAEGGFAVAEASFEGAAVHALGPGERPFQPIELVLPVALAPKLAAKLVEAGLTPIGEEAWEQVRIEAGIPKSGRELTENANPLEAGLLAAVSFTKGCYIGQEVVARLNSYSKVQRNLVGVKFPQAVDPAAVNEIFWDLLRIGHATSVARSPRLGATIAHAFVKTEYSKPGTPVYTVCEGEHLNGTLCELPFA